MRSITSTDRENFLPLNIKAINFQELYSTESVYTHVFLNEYISNNKHEIYFLLNLIRVPISLSTPYFSYIFCYLFFICLFLRCNEDAYFRSISNRFHYNLNYNCTILLDVHAHIFVLYTASVKPNFNGVPNEPCPFTL